MAVPPPASPLLTARFGDALALARKLHETQKRKGTAVPYLSHLLSVSALVIEDGGDEDEAIAALLHDAVEDQGGLPTLEVIREWFGDRVAGIVLECTDTAEDPKPAWKKRKESYLDHIADASPSAIRVSCADKLHNARSLLRDHRRMGERLWERFNAGRDDTLWYYRELVQAFAARGAGLADDLARVVSELEAEVTGRG
jgi:(p)ppGpp synthase/HD superfamily hydrolase